MYFTPPSPKPDYGPAGPPIVNRFLTPGRSIINMLLLHRFWFLQTF